MGETLSARELLFLQAMSEAEVLGATKSIAGFAKESRSLWQFGSDRWDWSSPGQAEWEALTTEERRRWVPENRREVPERGDILLLVDGQPVPHGELGEMDEQYDHSAAYSLLEQAGIDDIYADPDEEGAPSGMKGAKILLRLMKLWMRTIARPVSTGATESVLQACRPFQTLTRPR